MVAVARPVVYGDVLSTIKAKNFVLVTGFALLTALLAQVTIDLDFLGVAITGGTLGALLAGAVLGSKLGTISQVTYVVLGLFLPFYGGAEKGWDVLTGGSGGYLFGMILAAYLVGRLAERGDDRDYLTSISAMVAGTAAIFTVAAIWVSTVDGLGIDAAIAAVVTPLLVADTIKALFAGILLPIVWKLTAKHISDKE